MRRQDISSAAAAMLAMIAVAANPAVAAAAPQQLHCVLTDTAAHPNSENRPLVVVFDDAASTLRAQDDDHNYNFSKVSISNVAITGRADDVSVGIDRSSFGIVWQRYETDTIVTEYGRCRPSDDTATPPPAH